MRQARDFQTFDPRAQVGTDYARPPFDDGEAAQSAARMFSRLSGVLQGLVRKAQAKFDKAEAETSGRAGVAEAEGAIGLPQVNYAGGDETTRRRKAIQAIESSGNYQALGPVTKSGDRAYGAYQVMGNNIGPWSQAALGRRLTPEQFLADPKAQDAIFDHRFGGYVDKFGPADAASMWFTGRPQSRGGGARDALGTSGDQYVAKFMRGYGGAQPAARSTFVPDPKPLALRRDGTTAGDAYDRSVIETSSWRITAGLEAELNQAAFDHAEDPVAWGQARDTIIQKYAKQAGDIDPALGQSIQARGFDRAATYDQHIWTGAETRANGERKQAAGAALAASGEGLERQAYLIGAAKDGDARLAQLSADAMGAIDAAVASNAITPAEAVKHRQNVVQSLTVARLQGVFDALPDVKAKQDFVAGLDETYKDAASPLAQLEPAQFRALRGQFAEAAAGEQRKLDASDRLDKVKFKALIGDDVASLKATGKPLAVGGLPLDAGEVARVLGPEQALAWAADRSQAQATWAATAGMQVQTVDQIEARLAALAPSPGSEGFADQAKVESAASRVAAKILKARKDDPAQAVHDAFPALDELTKDPAHAQPLLRARLEAQEALGIGELARQPLTNGEAQKLADRLLLVEDNAETLDAEMKAMMQEAQAAYGEMADEVMAQVLRVRGVSRQTSLIGAALMLDLGIGKIPDQAALQQLQGAQARDQAEAAIDGAAVVKPRNRGEAMAAAKKKAETATAAGRNRGNLPTAASVNLLKSNPALAAQFDQQFGAGEADKYLTGRAAPVREKLADGTVKLTYPDGFVELLRPDGTVDGIAPTAGAKPQ